VDELNCVKHEHRALRFAYKGSAMQQHMGQPWHSAPDLLPGPDSLHVRRLEITDVQGRPVTVHYDLYSLMGEDEDHVGAQRRTSTAATFVRCTRVVGPTVVP
jgi:hypothetical protein